MNFFKFEKENFQLFINYTIIVLINLLLNSSKLL